MSGTILFLITEDWYFCSHRLPIARAAKNSGFDVLVVTRVRDHGSEIENEGFSLVPLEIRRSSLNPLADLWVLFALIAIYRKYRPAVVHHVALKPVLYGAIAARITGVPCVVNALTGMGLLFSSEVRGVFAMLRPIVRLLLKFVLTLGNSKVILQNFFDRDSLVLDMGLPESAIAVIRGSGVDVVEFAPTVEPDGIVRVTLVSRLIWEKGVGDLVEAADLLRSRGVPCVITLVGSPDKENPKTIDEEQLRAWGASGAIEWWGRRTDIANVWRQSHIACLPTHYREGLPKSLLEAAACGRPIVTSDNPACLELVADGVNGFVVPAKNVTLLADAIEKLVSDPELRRRMGSDGRRLVEKYFSQEIVAEQTLALYRGLLERNDLIGC